MPLFGSAKTETGASDETTGDQPKKKYDQLPAGTHAATAKMVRVKQTSTGRIMFSVLWTDKTGRGAWQNIVAPDANSKEGHIKAFYKQMNAVGLPPDVVDTYESPEELAKDLEGANAIVSVDEDPQYGPKVRWVSESV